MINIFHPTWADVTQLSYGCFRITHELTLPGTPLTVYDAITGDISGWWDHSFSESPIRFYIEPKPGGGFYEIFDERGNGVLHATVIAANRGKLLRFDGPLGLSGKAIKIVHTYEFNSVGSDSTLLKLSVNMSGEIDEGLAETINRVWHHFLFECFKPYTEEGRHLLISFEENGKWGYKNNQGQVMIEPTYYIAGQFNQYGLAAVADDSGWVYIDMNGNRIIKPFIIDNGPDYFSEGLARFVNNGKIGFMDEQGAIVIPADFDFALPFSDGLAVFCIDCNQVRQDEYRRIEGGKWGYINKVGDVVVDPDYDKAGSFKNGRAEVFRGGEKIFLNREGIGE
jgi:hypothetical protein